MTVEETPDADEEALTRRVARLAAAETVAAAPPDATIRPPRGGDLPGASAPSDAATLAAPAERPQGRAGWPHISITLPETARAAAAPSARPSRPDLEVTGLLGEGGMGRVHLARQHSLDRDVAIKTLKPGTDASASSALLNEGVVTGHLEHPAIVPVHALGLDDDGRPVLVMKRIEGVSWRVLLRQPDHPAWATWAGGAGERLLAHLEILIQVCNAAHFAHSRGVVHRDIKPENVLIGQFGEVYLVDWGIAVRLRADGRAAPAALAGSPAYMAPEMVREAEVDARTDVYLLGATLHEVLVGEPRHGGASLMEALRSAVRSEPHAYDGAVPEELARLCNSATHRDPDARPRTALELRDAISDFLRHRGSFALSDRAAERLSELPAASARASDTQDPGDRARLGRLMTECRFGFLEALRAWDGNAAARSGLAACLEAMIRVEIGRRDPQAARALLLELAEARPDLDEQVSALERAIEEERLRGEDARRLAHDLDASVSAGQRTAALAVLGVLGTGVSAAALWADRAGAGLTRPDLVGFIGALIAVQIGTLAVFRRHLLKNAFNRRVAGLMFVLSGAILANRVASLPFETPVPEVFTRDLILFAAVLAMGALSLLRWMWWGVALLAGAAAASAAFPARAPVIFSLATSAIVVLAVAMWQKR